MLHTLSLHNLQMNSQSSNLDVILSNRAQSTEHWALRLIRSSFSQLRWILKVNDPIFLTMAECLYYHINKVLQIKEFQWLCLEEGKRIGALTSRVAWRIPQIDWKLLNACTSELCGGQVLEIDDMSFNNRLGTDYNRLFPFFSFLQVYWVRSLYWLSVCVHTTFSPSKQNKSTIDFIQDQLFNILVLFLGVKVSSLN